MKQGKKEEAESIKTEVARLKDTNKALQEAMDRAQQELTTLLCAIPNIPYDIVPEGNGAEDNVVVTMGGMETELPKDALPHWELAKKYNLIDFDLGVKITGRVSPSIAEKAHGFNVPSSTSSSTRHANQATKKSCLLR